MTDNLKMPGRFKKYIVHAGLYLFLAVFISSVIGQTAKKSSQVSKPTAQATPKPSPKQPTQKSSAKSPTPKPAPDPELEKKRFDDAIAISDPSEKAAALIKFISEFPKSELRQRALESLAVSRAALAEQNLLAGNTELALRLLDLSIDEAPKPFSDKLFKEVISKIPGGLFWRGQREAAFRLAGKIEQYVSEEPQRLLEIASFYLSIESGREAARIAERVLEIDQNSAAAYVTIGMANRIDFDLEKAEAAYQKAVDLAPSDKTARRGLADIRRALGKSDSATEIYRSLVAEDENDDAARTGLILSLFEAGKPEDANALLSKSIDADDAGIFLLGGVAHWYAANGSGNKAVDFARRALAKDPRYVWAQIALARGLVLTGKPVEAEQVLIAARKLGNFPTLQYEIAAARLAAGFFRDAADGLSESFDLSDGKLKTRLSGRIERASDNFTELLAPETRAAIFSPLPLINDNEARLLKSLLGIKKLSALPEASNEELIAVAKDFASGTDNMAPHRALYTARLLAGRGIGLDLALTLCEIASNRLDDALSVSNPAAAVMAPQLYEARETAFGRNEFLLIPDVPRQTLSAIYRGEIEETIGLTLFAQGKPEDAATRFRRALTVYPKDSAWWRSAMWNLGTSLEAAGEDREALKSYIASYKIDRPNPSRYLTIARLYKKLNSNIDGLEAEIGPSPFGNLNLTNDSSANSVISESEKEQTTEKEKQLSSTASEPVTEQSSGNKTPETAALKNPEPPKDDKTTNVSPAENNEGTPESGRPRIVPGKEVKEVTLPAKCNLTPSQQTVSILNNGGNIALLLDFDRDLGIDAIKAVSDSPDDVRVDAEPEIAGIRGRALFIIRSISTKTGFFNVSFASPCGSVSVKVIVR